MHVGIATEWALLHILHKRYIRGGHPLVSQNLKEKRRKRKKEIKRRSQMFFYYIIYLFIVWFFSFEIPAARGGELAEKQKRIYTQKCRSQRISIWYRQIDRFPGNWDTLLILCQGLHTYTPPKLNSTLLSLFL
jgi:hypothetical protein